MATELRRFRLVDTQNGNRHVSSVVLAEEEVEPHLDAEATMHRLAGWRVTRGEGIVVCRKGRKRRSIHVESFTPFDDIYVGRNR